MSDAATVNDFGQREERDGDSTAGSYEVRLPDTRLQRVVYTVDGDSGFIADVEFDGEAQHPEEYGGAAAPAGRGYGAPAQSRGPLRSYSEPETSYEPAPSPPKVSYRPAPSPPKVSYRPAPTTSKPSYRPAPTTSKPSYRPAPTTPKTSYESTQSQPETSYAPSPSPPKRTYRPAASPPKTSYRPTTSPAKVSYRPAPSPGKVSYRPTTSQPAPSYTTTEAPATTEPSVYGSKKLKFARVPSDVYDKPLFRADYERAVHGRGRGGGGGRPHKKQAPARYGPSAVLIGSDDDRYLVPTDPGLNKLLAAPWVSYRKAVDAYLAKEDQAHAEDDGQVTYAGGRGEEHADSEAAASSEVPFGARIAPK